MDKIKRYFLFDNESITGTTFLIRFVTGTVLVIFLESLDYTGQFPRFLLLPFLIICLCLISSTAYKRCSAFNWDKKIKFLCTVLIPLLPILNLIKTSEKDFIFYAFMGINLVWFILLAKNGNK